MKVKEVNITANVVWSPSNITPVYLACGTAAQQLDASFNSSSVLQLYDLSLNESSLDMKLAASKSVPAKFHHLLWKGSSEGALGQDSGILVGGCDDAAVHLYSVDKLLKNEEPLLVSLKGKHSGPVYALDFNHHQTNLLVSGSSNCEIFIWDINDSSSPMTPGVKPNLAADVTSVGWNRQVEHIMASTYGGRCVVYDLRKSTSIIQISESVARIKPHNIDWHPSVATQLIITSNDDSTPVAQVWDLRFAASPVSVLESHMRGISASKWCPEDPDLFITCGKDNRIIVWNPNSSMKGGEIVGEFPAYNQWSFDLAWCPKDPSLVATATIDSYVSVYSLLGAGSPPSQTSKFSAIADSFPGMEMPSEIPQATISTPIQLKKPPKWFAPRSGISFGFGGRLVSWNNDSRTVTISQVITEPELVSNSDSMEIAFSQDDLRVHCQAKAQGASTDNAKILWKFLGASFESSARSHFSHLLGFSANAVAERVRPHSLAVDAQKLQEKISDLSLDAVLADSSSSLDPAEQFEMIASTNSTNKTPEIVEPVDKTSISEDLHLEIGDDSAGLLRHALLLGDLESAVEICLQESNYSLALILAAEAGNYLFEKTRDRVLHNQSQSGVSVLVTHIVKKKLDDIVLSCNLKDWKAALVSILTYAVEQELPTLSEALGDRLESAGHAGYLQAALLCFICAGNVDRFAGCFRKAKPHVDTSPIDLQDLVEILVILQRALLSCGRTVHLEQKGAANYALTRYASLLASQGALNKAIQYLGKDSQGEISALRERLGRALGYKATASSAGMHRIRSVSSSSQHSLRRSSTPLGYQPTSQFQQNIPVQPTKPEAHVPHVFFVPGTAATPQPAQMMPVAAPLPGSYSGFQSAAPPPIVPASDISNSAFGARRIGVGRYINTTPTPSNVWPPTNIPYNPATNIPSGGFMTPAAPPASFTSPTPMVAPTSVGGFQQMSASPGGFQHPLATQYAEHPQESPLPPPAAFDPSVPRGWNDPPAVSASRKLAGGHAIAGTVIGEHSGAKRLSTLKAKQKNIATSANQLSDGPHMMVNKDFMPQQFTPQSLASNSFPTTGPPHLPSSGAFIEQAGDVDVPVVKVPIPSEHRELQEVFDCLRERGLQIATNPTAKQRLEDVGPKLEALYDKLRAQAIGKSTTDGLHLIVASIRTGDYHQALIIHSATVSAGNFTEMVSFMPALKMLLSTCMQCQVFLQ